MVWDGVVWGAGWAGLERLLAGVERVQLGLERFFPILERVQLGVERF
ncbi:hypothetical protein J11TS1_38460 [Oceanobacillus sp. J11TS1]|nr:hypothetical protein J11TS1_38460 [Oceanobacillus sp. J11TS1]